MCILQRAKLKTSRKLWTFLYFHTGENSKAHHLFNLSLSTLLFPHWTFSRELQLSFLGFHSTPPWVPGEPGATEGHWGPPSATLGTEGHWGPPRAGPMLKVHFQESYFSGTPPTHPPTIKCAFLSCSTSGFTLIGISLEELNHNWKF